MHIAVVTRHMGAGGAERVIAQLLNNWCAQGVRCSLFCMNPQPAFYPIPDAVTYYDIPFFSENRWIDKIKKYAHLRKRILAAGPDVVLALPEEIGAYVIPALAGTGIPVVVSERNNPWVMPDKKFTRLVRKAAYPFAGGLIFQTEQAAAFFPQKQQEKGIVLPNPLDSDRLPPVSDGPREKIVLSAGRLEPQKNFSLLIRAFAQFHETHPDHRLVIYGDGSQRQELEALAEKLLPENSWSMPGKVENLPEKMAESEIFALTSDYEGMPNVLIEAMAMGTPCISTDCAPGGAQALIDNGKNGMIVPVSDEVALVKGMCYLADHPQTAKNIGERAVEIRQTLDAKAVSGQWRTYLEKTAKKKQKDQKALVLPLKNRQLTINYQSVLIILFTILTLISGWALGLGDNTMATGLTKLIRRLGIYGSVLGIVLIYLRNPRLIDWKQKALLFAPVLYWCMYFFLQYDTGLPANLVATVAILLFAVLQRNDQRQVYVFFRKLLVIVCAVGVLFYVLRLLGMDFLFKKHDYYSAAQGGNYYSYVFGAVYEKHGQMRLCGHYNEPGMLGTVTALMLCVENMDLRKPGNIILFLAGCLTLSVAFYIMIAAYLMFKCIPLIVKKPILLIGVAVLALLYLFVLPHIQTGIEGIDRVLQRLVLTKDGLAGDNRSNGWLNELTRRVILTRSFLIGQGAGYIELLDIGSVSSFKVYIVEYGLVGFLLIFGSLIRCALRRAGKNWNAISMIAVFTLSIYQRPNVLTILFFVILYGGIEHILHRDLRTKRKRRERRTPALK